MSSSTFAPSVVVHPLGDGAGGDVDDQRGAAEVVGDDAVGDAALDHVVGHVDPGGVDEAADDVAGAVELGDGLELVLVEEALDQRAVDLLADAAVRGRR